MRNRGARTLQTNRLHRAIKAFTVFCFIDRILICTDKLDTVCVQYTFAHQIKRTVKCRLPAHRGQKRIRLFFFYDARNSLPLYRLDIGCVRHRGIGHDRGWIAVNQNDSITFFTQRFTGLCA